MSIMARNDRVNALREQARKLERNAGKKISRLRNSENPVELSGTQFDVRRGAGNLSTMRSRDLERHINRLSEFNSRKSRFMQTETGPAGPDVVNKFLKAQNKVNRDRRAKMDQFGDVKMPNSDENMRQKWAVKEVAQRRMSDPSANNPFREVDKLGIKYATPDAIARMADKFERQARPNYGNEERERNRQTLDKILARVHMPELEALVHNQYDEEGNLIHSMSDEAFDLMWFNPDFMTGQGLIYAQTIARDKGEMSAGQIEVMDQTLETETSEAITIAQWAIRVGMGR